ncbi:EAL domain-containing protein [Alteromonas sp. C1M14]|nr:EAL domain-containing protein [Alteromonas sp. C1M14]
MLLFFLVVIAFVVLFTLLLVGSATFTHSTQQLLTQTRTSASVVEDKLNNHAQLLLRAADNLSGNYTIKQYIAAKDDPDSLAVAMRNQQQRIDADMFMVLDQSMHRLTSTSDLAPVPANLNGFLEQGLSWYDGADGVYLMKGVPVKFVERSRRTDAWVFLGYDGKKLINENIAKLTELDVSLLIPDREAPLLSSTLPTALSNAFFNLTLNYTPGLHTATLEDANYIYTSKQVGFAGSDPVYIVLATLEDKAYLSYNSMQLQLVGLLLLAGFVSLLGALMLSRGITGPLNKLAVAANSIRMGKHVTHFPESSTAEVDALSLAINDMQTGIQVREKQINQLAYYDDLTGLPNRNQFITQLEATLKDNPCGTVAVLMLDIDRFKDINDTVGHDTGDLLIQHIAKRLNSINEMTGFLARLGGDEFGFIVTCLPQAELESVVNKVAAVFDHPFNIEGLILEISCSIGASQHPQDGETAQGLMQCADIALYHCKDSHQSFALYSAQLNKHSVQRLNLMSELKSALQAGQLQYYYQPKLDIASNTFTSVECLMRWIHPEHGFISPDDFIPLAEQTGAIRNVTNWGLRTALKQQKAWREKGHNISVAVNISAVDLIDMTLPTLVSNLLSKYNSDAKYLTLEVTESAIMHDPENALRALNALKRMGIKLSIDDFGTGYSSMAQLKDMPVHELKIDKAFVLSLASSNDDKTLVNTIVSLAKNLHLEVVAEGVEDKASLDYLREVGCTRAQGYYMSRPLPAEQFDEWLTTAATPSIVEGAVQ